MRVNTTVMEMYMLNTKHCSFSYVHVYILVRDKIQHIVIIYCNFVTS